MGASGEVYRLAALEISLIPGLGPITQGKLCRARGELASWFSASVRELEMLGISRDAAAAMHGRRYRPMAEEIADWAVREQCLILARGSPGYPPLLEEISDPPLVLYCKGLMESLDASRVAIVGTRRPTYYGLQMAQGLAFDLGKRGVSIVSGLARGIDAAAHRGCLEAEGRTVAVFGCGIDVVYPREHRRLTEEISERGLLVSEFPPGTAPAPQNFPVRNRVISGLSMGTLIVEANEYSGSLITARLALEQNREVFALPGNLTSPQSFGPNYLIKQGAKLVQVWRDIVEEFPAEARAAILTREDSGSGAKQPPEEVTGEEDAVLQLLDAGKATQFDRILQGSGLGVPRLSEVLLDLEIRGFVRQVPGNLFIRAARPGE